MLLIFPDIQKDTLIACRSSRTAGSIDDSGALGSSQAEETLGRKVNPTLYTPEDFVKKVQSDNQFVTRVLEQPKIALIGNVNDLAAGKPAESA